MNGVIIPRVDGLPVGGCFYADCLFGEAKAVIGLCNAVYAPKRFTAVAVGDVVMVVREADCKKSITDGALPEEQGPAGGGHPL